MAQYWWIGANIVTLLALGVIITVFAQRYMRASVPLPHAEVVLPSVKQQRWLNARSAMIDIIFYALLWLLGLSMIIGGITWDYYADGTVPWIIPGGTIVFMVIYLGKAVTRLWESSRRETILELAEEEARTVTAARVPRVSRDAERHDEVMVELRHNTEVVEATLSEAGDAKEEAAEAKGEAAEAKVQATAAHATAQRTIDRIDEATKALAKADPARERDSGGC